MGGKIEQFQRILILENADLLFCNVLCQDAFLLPPLYPLRVPSVFI